MYKKPIKFLLMGLSVLAMALGLAGTVTAADDDTIVLGAAVSLTGKYSTNGKYTKDGYDLAVARVNEMGGVKVGDKTYQLKVVYYDDESTPARGAQLVERLIAQDNVKFMLGPYSSGLTKAMAPVTEKYQIPMVEANGASVSLFDKGYRYLFAILSSTEYYLRSAVDLLYEQAKENGKDPSKLRIALAFENDPFSQDIRTGVINQAKEYGMKIVVDDKLPPDLNDMTATLTKVKALRADALLVSGHAKGATLVVRQANEMHVRVPMMATTHCDSAKIAENQPEAAEGFLCASQWDRSLNYKDQWFGTAEEYAQLYEKTYGVAPPYQAAESSAAVLVYYDALQRAGSLDPKKVRDAIAATDLQTFYGHIKFNDAGMNIAKPMVLYQVRGGEYKVVAPSKWANTKLEYPLK